MMSTGVDVRTLKDRLKSRMPSLTPEFELLLECCAQRFRGGLSISTQDFVAQQYDWKSFINLAEQHGVIPQVYGSVAPHSGRLPSQEFALLRSNYEENARKTLWFTGELVRILKHLERRGIKAMPYKGPALAQTLYGDVTGRQFGDIDILVYPQDVGAAKEALAKLGYRPAIRLNARQERAYISAGYECAFDSAVGPHLLELQWRILPRFYSVEFDMTGLFKRAVQFTLDSCSFPTLGVNDLLIVLCVHAAKHVWAQLSWLCDIAELARSPRIDWEATWQRAWELGLQRIVALNFLLAHDLFGLALPIPVQQYLGKDHACQSLKVELSRIITCGLHYDTESFAYFRLMLRLRERRSDQARFLSRLIWTPGIGEWSAIHLPERLFSAYYFVRLGRLAKKVGGRFAAPPSGSDCPTGQTGGLQLTE